MAAAAKPAHVAAAAKPAHVAAAAKPAHVADTTEAAPANSAASEPAASEPAVSESAVIAKTDAHRPAVITGVIEGIVIVRIVISVRLVSRVTGRRDGISHGLVRGSVGIVLRGRGLGGHLRLRRGVLRLWLRRAGGHHARLPLQLAITIDHGVNHRHRHALLLQRYDVVRAQIKRQRRGVDVADHDVRRDAALVHLHHFRHARGIAGQRDVGRAGRRAGRGRHVGVAARDGTPRQGQKKRRRQGCRGGRPKNHRLRSHNISSFNRRSLSPW